MIGKQVRQYKILEELGRGGMGVVYLAEDSKLSRNTALKFIHTDVNSESQSFERFEQEARTIAALNHPNIVTVYDISDFEGMHYIAMEYVDGISLRESINGLNSEEEGMSVNEVLDIAIQMCDGLHEAHRSGIVHRDLKPENIFVDRSGRVRILDFGLAKLKSRGNLTRESVVMGTVNYMSPEQMQGLPLDHRTDIWSFGVILYELLTGCHPFSSEYEQAALYAIVNEDPTPLSEKRPDVPPALQQIVDRCLKKSPEERPDSFSEIESELKEIRGLTTARIALPIAEKPRTKWLAGITGFVIALLLLWVLVRNQSFIADWWSDIRIPEQKHLVVLPFDNISRSESDQIFCDGLLATITSKITELEREQPSFWVVPSAEVRSREVASISEAHRVFKANLVITGSFQNLGDWIRLTMNLVDAEKVRQLKSVVVTNKPDSTVNFQDRIVEQIGALLSLNLPSAELAALNEGSTAVPGAWEFYVQGRGYLQRPDKPENIENAIRLFDQALAQDSLYALAHEGLALAYSYKYDYTDQADWLEAALSECRTALQLDNRQSNTHVTLGRIYFQASDYEKAEAAFQQALSLNKKNSEALIFLARTYEKLNRYEQAEANLKAAIQLKPDYWIGYNMLGEFYLNLGQFDNAVGQFKQVTNLTPDNIWGFNNLGGAYLRQGQFDKAREMFEQSIAIKPNYKAYSNLGNLYYFQQNYAAAVEAYEQALALNDSDYLVWGLLAEGYSKSGADANKIKETRLMAIKKAEAQRAIRPNDPALMADLAGYYADVGEKKKAGELIGNALQYGTQDVYTMYLAGYIYEKIGQREKAMKWICAALQNGYPPTELEQDESLQALRTDENFDCGQVTEKQ